MSFEFFVAEGDPFLAGKTLGEKHRGIVKKAIQDFYGAEVVKRGTPRLVPTFFKRWVIKRFAKKIMERVKEHFPEIHEFTQEYAEGAGIDVLTIYELNTFETLSGAVKKEWFLMKGRGTMQCTGLVYRDFVAKNYDFPDEFEEFQYVRLLKIKGRYATFSLAHHVVPGTHAGMNENWLSPCLHLCHLHGLQAGQHTYDYIPGGAASAVLDRGGSY